MLRNFLKNRKAQNTAEYALLIALVVAGVIAMQTYAQRALQARVHDASQYLTNQTSNIGTSTQYEPYYLNSEYNVTSSSVENKTLGRGTGDYGQVAQDTQSNRLRSGSQTTTYDNSKFN